MNCPYCGTKLNKSNLGRYFCPNCGCVGEDREIKKGEDENPSYVG